MSEEDLVSNRHYALPFMIIQVERFVFNRDIMAHPQFSTYIFGHFVSKYLLYNLAVIEAQQYQLIRLQRRQRRHREGHSGTPSLTDGNTGTLQNGAGNAHVQRPGRRFERAGVRAFFTNAVYVVVNLALLLHGRSWWDMDMTHMGTSKVLLFEGVEGVWLWWVVMVLMGLSTRWMLFKHLTR